MAPGPGCTSQTTILSGGGGGCIKGSSESAMEDQNGDTVGNLNQNIGKPPRDHSVMRHCSSSSWLAESVSMINYNIFFYLHASHSWQDAMA